jgi:hypothetical protein
MLDSLREVAWPPDLSSWFDLALLTLIVLFKFDRANTLRVRARFYDRLGLSTITADYVFAVVYVYAVVITLYPALRIHEELRWPVRIVAALAIGWAWFEVRRASRHRIETAMGDGNATTADVDLWRGGHRRDRPVDAGEDW